MLLKKKKKKKNLSIPGNASNKELFVYLVPLYTFFFLVSYDTNYSCRMSKCFCLS